ncbi:UNVERIFIED_CONTAM: hypothetical protein PYX00_007816 [Menopon gallinae]|uniref:Ribulose-1,5-bisphosphate carboxylase/oxygenase large subunit n=1 Tax=Menopon gallinae TaxID=328185 RepID=A0AAW2HKB2_9NEOP
MSQTLLRLSERNSCSPRTTTSRPSKETHRGHMSRGLPTASALEPIVLLKVYETSKDWSGILPGPLEDE